ncbi:hypothetical protein FIU97_13210 [Roseivivax sp. THAF40]|nr:MULTISPECIES: hypothetical protein [unclassified Roseivivax]QFS83732.1 hypothetical protein FIV09_12920 [Roseivivax sp. THAF197b]QFT47534.1 hypothetical protein FIU97_13210 [Roseivivax sp. THAF40]
MSYLEQTARLNRRKALAALADKPRNRRAQMTIRNVFAHIDGGAPLAGTA